MLSFTSDQWVIVALIFVLGLLIGGFLFSGGGRKWKTRYRTEVDRREELEGTHNAREKEWREQDSLRGAADRDRNRDGVDDRKQVRGSRDHVIDPRGGDRDHDGIPDNRDPRDDRRG